MNSLLQSLKRRIEILEPRISVLEAFHAGYMAYTPAVPTYADVTRRDPPIVTRNQVIVRCTTPFNPSNSSPESSPLIRVSRCPEISPSVRHTLRDQAASKYNFSVLYLRLPCHMKPKVGNIRKRLSENALTSGVANISIVGLCYIEVLVDNSKAIDWTAQVKDHFKVMDDVDVLNVSSMLLAYPNATTFGTLFQLLQIRLSHEIKDARTSRPRVADFYQDWSHGLISTQAHSTPPRLP